MFAESLLESNAAATRRGWTTLVSLSSQALLLAGLASISILRPVDLPADLKIFHLPTVEPIVIPLVSEPPSKTNPKFSVSPPRHVIEVPSSGKIHYGPPRVQSEDSPLLPPHLPLGLLGNNSLTNVIDHANRNFVSRPKTNDQPLRVSTLAQGQLISRVQPAYPMAAKMAGIQGQVVLAAIISKAGLIESLQVKIGHPLLAPAARDAVKQWRYRPYVLNGEAIEVETQITVDFKLGR